MYPLCWALPLNILINKHVDDMYDITTGLNMAYMYISLYVKFCGFKNCAVRTL